MTDGVPCEAILLVVTVEVAGLVATGPFVYDQGLKSQSPGAAHAYAAFSNSETASIFFSFSNFMVHPSSRYLLLIDFIYACLIYANN
ncbi:hypothetical protein [Comamonas odontotermitis]|uniref:hypothetical protein n=1 Tax=Comamonas odontotermitis TaxID=379895 RepID=UPI003751C481